MTTCFDGAIMESSIFGYLWQREYHQNLIFLKFHFLTNPSLKYIYRTFDTDMAYIWSPLCPAGKLLLVRAVAVLEFWLILAFISIKRKSPLSCHISILLLPLAFS